MLTSRRSILAGTLATAGCASTPAAVVDHTREYVLPFSETIPLHSQVNDIRYKLYVRTPASYQSEENPLPIIVTLDADYSFVIAANHLEHLADRLDQGPKAILVSVAYDGVYPDVTRYRMERSRDYTPFFFPTGGYGPEYQARSGGGPAFLRVLTEEVLPLVRSRYRADQIDATIVGHSYGGLFAAWTLQNHPEAFQRYLMVSPSLWYADLALLAAERNLQRTRLARTTYVYAAAGALEAPPQIENDMAGQVATFADMLRDRGDPNLRVGSRIFEDETHASIFPAAFSTGIRHLFRRL